MMSLRRCDIVYCWVWGEHPRVRDMFEEHGVELQPHRTYSHSFIARSIELVRKNMRWHEGRIVLVSACGLAPPGLDLARHRVEVVDQEAILPPEHRPAFSNMVTESALHRVPGLTDRFLYMNDDQFALQPIPLEVFEGPEGDITFFRNDAATMEDLRRRNHRSSRNVWAEMALHTAGLARRAWGTELGEMQLMQHLPYVMDREVLRRVAETFRGEVDAMGRRHTARHPEDIIVVFLHQEWWRAHRGDEVRWACYRANSANLAYRCEKMVPRNQETIARLLHECSISMLTLSESCSQQQEQTRFMLQSIKKQLAALTAAAPVACEREVPRPGWRKFICGCSKSSHGQGQGDLQEVPGEVASRPL